MDARESLNSKWDQRHADPERKPQAAAVLSENRHLLPSRGEALDLACGLGGNAVLMARAGLRVTAWDISPVAIERLNRIACELGLDHLSAGIRDVEQSPPPADRFDVIVVSHYLHRPLLPGLITSLRQGGLLYYQTFTRIAVGEQGPSNPDYRLADNELLAHFSPLAIRFYREENLLGDQTKGHRDLAMLVAEKV